MNRQHLKTLAASLWLFLVILLIGLAWVFRPVLDTSMMNLLPDTKQQPLVQAAAEQAGQQFSQRLFILVNTEDETNRQSAVRQLANAFEQLPVVASVDWQLDAAALDKTQRDLSVYRYVLLTDAIADQIDTGKTEKIRQQALSRIIAPGGNGTGDLKKDPFGLITAWQSQQTLPVNINFQGDFLQLAEQPESYLIIVNLAADAFAMSTQRAVLDTYKKQQIALAEKGVSLQASGLLIHADAGARQAKQEMSTIGLGSLAGIIILMLVVFRRRSTAALILLPVIIGCIVATAVSFITFSRLHIVTFAFGAGLIGVAIDYALHFLCERQVNRKVLNKILPGLLLGLLSSVLAYAALAITPFPGLQQMALFSIVGLIAAWLTVVLWLPLLTRNLTPAPIASARTLQQGQSLLPQISGQRWLIAALCLMTVAAVWVIYNGQAEDDIRLLQTSPPELIEQERQIQKLLGLDNGTQFFLVTCDAIEQCLQNERLLKPILQSWQQSGDIGHYRLLSDRLPSLKQQQQNAARVEKLYQAELASLFATLNLPETATQQAVTALKKDIDKRLIPGISKDSAFSSAAQQIVDTEAGMATVVSVSSENSLKTGDIKKLQQTIPGLVFVDQVAAISDLMADYRQQIMIWLALAYGIVLLILIWRYQKSAWRIIVPPLLASIYTLALLMLWLPGINLFHIMALILVLGIGVDMGIFLAETQQAAQTWLAVSLSVITSMLAFGLLALSQTPVLHHFGLTVLLGLTMVWLLASFIRQSPSGSQKIA